MTLAHAIAGDFAGDFEATNQSFLPPNMQILDAREYEMKVLSLEQGRTERDLDVEYIHEAQDVGIDMLTSLSRPRDSTLSWLSTDTAATNPYCRSDSLDSRRSCSTGLTSNFSRTSTDHYYATHPYHLRFKSQPRTCICKKDERDFSVCTTPNKSETSLPATATTSISGVDSPAVRKTVKRAFNVRSGLGRLSRLGKSSPTKASK